ncbi:hypothetical protein [Cerasicoccus maritimus]|uniref:hypothetical protein n=1 Tax=Cerasicoccus maritimus TaxID=490089 RepID=UPI0028527A6B|nr:hypothetical protein [Cerasicoccus maritimus]
MSTQKVEKEAKKPEAKPGFFTRIISKLDSSMKEKADAKAQQSCCGGDGKGGKCC